MVKESRRYRNDIERFGEDLATRPVEMYKKGYNDKTSLILKSSEIDYNELSVTKDGLKLDKPLKNNIYTIEDSSPFKLDLSKSSVQQLKLTDDAYITDIINFEDNVDYYLIIEQDSVGGRKIAWEKTPKIKFKNSQPSETAESISVLKITSFNGVIYGDIN
ncbi:MAG: hypothetical protein ACOC2W_04805 [bacterium]